MGRIFNMHFCSSVNSRKGDFLVEIVVGRKRVKATDRCPHETLLSLKMATYVFHFNNSLLWLILKFLITSLGWIQGWSFASLHE